MTYIELNISADDVETLNLAAASALEWLPDAKITSYTANGHVPTPPDVDQERVFRAMHAAVQAGAKVTAMRDDGQREKPMQRIAQLEEALQGAISGIEDMSREHNSITGFAGARLSDARHALGRDGAERVRSTVALRTAMEHAIAHFGRLETRKDEPILAEMRAALKETNVT